MPCLCLKQSSRYTLARYCTLPCTFEVCALLLAGEFYSFSILLHYCHFSMHSHSLLLPTTTTTSSLEPIAIKRAEGVMDRSPICSLDQRLMRRPLNQFTSSRALPNYPPDTLAWVTWIVFNLDAIGSLSRTHVCNKIYI